MRSSTVRPAWRILAAACGVAGIAGPAPFAWASAIGVPEQDMYSIAQSTAGESTEAVPSISYYNPAGMVLIKGTQFESDFTYYDIDSHVHAGLTPDPAQGPGPGLTGTANSFVESTLVATAFGVFSLPHGWKLGFSVTQPNGGRVKYPGDFIGNVEGSEALLTNIQFGADLAIPVTDHLSIGGGPVVSYFENILGVSQNIPGFEAETPNGQGAVGRFEGKSTVFGYNVGAMYQFDDATRIGVDYRSKITHDVKGVERVYDGELGTILGPLAPPTYSNAEDNFTFPQTVNFGAFRQLDREWAVMANAQWENWGAYQTLYINDPTTAQAYLVGPNISPIVENVHFRNAWTVGIATAYTPIRLPGLMVTGGVGYDETPVPSGSYRITGLPDNNRVMLGFGASYQLTRRTSVMGAYAHYFVQDGGIRDQRLNETGGTSYSGTLVGEYKIAANVFSVGIVSKF